MFNGPITQLNLLSKLNVINVTNNNTSSNMTISNISCARQSTLSPEFSTNAPIITEREKHIPGNTVSDISIEDVILKVESFIKQAGEMGIYELKKCKNDVFSLSDINYFAANKLGLIKDGLINSGIKDIIISRVFFGENISKKYKTVTPNVKILKTPSSIKNVNFSKNKKPVNLKNGGRASKELINKTRNNIIQFKINAGISGCEQLIKKCNDANYKLSHFNEFSATRLELIQNEIIPDDIRRIILSTIEMADNYVKINNPRKKV